jgi:riboflavin kinase / FMN adenylyltransferase
MERVRLEALALRASPTPVVTVGNFDGVHLGHRALVQRTVAEARAAGGTAVVMTFDPHPARVLNPARAPAALTTPAQKQELLEGLGVDRLVVVPFTAKLASSSPETFVADVLVGALGARVVVVGESFRFGHRQAGDVARLSALGGELGFAVRALAPVLQDGRPVSSSRVREALKAGDVATARSLLGRSHFVDATVVRGDGRGKAIGVPTANLEPENEVVPGVGVYSGRFRFPDGAQRTAVVNVGRRPTFGGREITLEAHVLDFDGDLYGARVRLSFEERLRDERRFSGKQELVAQIRRDVEKARSLVSAAGDEKV